MRALFILVLVIALYSPGNFAQTSTEVDTTGDFREVFRMYNPPRFTNKKIVVGKESTLQDLLDYAAEHNPRLSAAYLRWQASMMQVNQVAALPEPRLSYGYFFSEVETRVGAQRQRIGISQTLPLFGKLRWKKEAQLQAAEAEDARIEAERLHISYRVKKHWYEYAYVHQANQVFEENVQLLELLEGVVRAKYRAGSTPHASLIKIQVELDRLRDRQVDMADLILPLGTALNAILDRPPGSELPRPADITVPDISESDSTWLELLRQRNPQLAVARSETAALKAKVKYAEKHRFPDLTIGLDYIFTDEAIFPDVRDSGKDPLMITASINLPLWRGKNRARVLEAQSRYISALHQLSAQENNLLAKQAMVVYRLTEAKRKVALYDNSLIPRSIQALNVSKAAFEAGDADILEVIDAQRTLLEFELLQVREKANLQQRLAELEMLVGKEL